MKRALFAMGVVGAAGAANAVLIIGGSLNASENFDGLPSTGTTALFSATPGVQSVVTGTTFDGTKLGGTGTALMNLIADDGGSNSGAIHSHGSIGSGERALGSLASGTNIPGMGVEIRNGSTVAIASITIRFTQENWRSSTTTKNTIAASWALSTTAGVNATNYLSVASGFTAITTLDLVGPDPVAANGALDGNLGANQFSRVDTITFGTALGIGESLFLRWQDVNDPGNDAGLAIDQFGVAATPVPEPASMAALALGAAALLRRRRR